MAALWGLLRAEVQATVDDLREKGAVGAFKDAALDTRDIAASTGGWLWTSVKDLVADDDEMPILRVLAPPPGSSAPLEFPDGSVVEALVLDVDTSAERPRARVQLPDTDEMVLVEVRGPATGLAAAVLRASALPEPGQQVRLHLPAGGRAAATVLEVNGEAEPPRILARAPGVEAPFSVLVVLPALPQAFMPQAAAADAAVAPGLLESETSSVTLGPQEELGVLDVLHQEWRDTVQEFRVKGAVGAVTDAALDAVDIVHDGARTVGTAVQPLAVKAVEAVQPIVDGAHALTVDLLGLDDEEPDPRQTAGASAAAASSSMSTPTVAGAGSLDVFDTALASRGAGEKAAASYLAACNAAAGGSASASGEPRSTPRSSQTFVAERRNMFEKNKKEEEQEGEQKEEGQKQEEQEEEFID